MRYERTSSIKKRNLQHWCSHVHRSSSENKKIEIESALGICQADLLESINWFIEVFNGMG